MSILTLRDAAFTATAPLFRNLSLTIGAGDRVGLIAGNGAGKTTLLRCISGDQDLTQGDMIRPRAGRIGVVAQDVAPALFDLTLYDAVLTALPADQRDSDSWRVDVLLDDLGTPTDLWPRPVRDLSGGWQRLMLLARVWVTEPDLLLLDEPTNHLDLEKIILLERWMKTQIGQTPVIIASHDRSFLDSVTNRTLFLRPDGSRLFPLPYTRAREALGHDDASDAVKQERDLSEAARLHRQSAKLKNIGLNSGSDLLQKKQKQLRERAEKIEEGVKSLHKERSGDIRLANRGTHAKVLVSIENLTVTQPDGTILFSIPKLLIAQGDRIAVLGGNGTGKSTLIRLLRTALQDGVEVDGVKSTPSLVTGYMDQGLSNVPPGRTPFDLIAGFGQGDTRNRALLAGAGINIDQQQRPSGTLSQGQRARLGLLALRLANPNFYLLDEPTNHIDIAGQEALANEVINHGASCVLVTHDRAFLRETANRFLVITQRGRQRTLNEADGPEAFLAAMVAG